MPNLFLNTKRCLFILYFFLMLLYMRMHVSWKTCFSAHTTRPCGSLSNGISRLDILYSIGKNLSFFNKMWKNSEETYVFVMSTKSFFTIFFIFRKIIYAVIAFYYFYNTNLFFNVFNMLILICVNIKKNLMQSNLRMHWQNILFDKNC